MRVVCSLTERKYMCHVEIQTEWGCILHSFFTDLQYYGISGLSFMPYIHIKYFYSYYLTYKIALNLIIFRILQTSKENLREITFPYMMTTLHFKTTKEEII